MRLFSRFRSAPAVEEADVIELDEAFVDELDAETSKCGDLLRLTPYRQKVDYGRNKTFLESMCLDRRGGRKNKENVSTPWAVEMVYWADSKTVHFRYAMQDSRTRRMLKRQVEEFYTDSDIETVSREDVLLNAEPGQYVASATLRLERNALYPLNNYKLDGEKFEEDPYNSIIKEMTGDRGSDDADANVLTQIVMKPALSNVPKPYDNLNWYHGVDEYADEIEREETGFRWAAVPEYFLAMFSDIDADEIDLEETTRVTKQDRKAAEIVANQRNMKGYHFNVRIVAVGDDPEIVQERVENVAEKYGSFYNATHNQGFEPVYFPDGGVEELLRRAARREWIDDGNTQSLVPAAGFAQPPSDLTNPAVVYTTQKADYGAPADMPRAGDVIDRTSVEPTEPGEPEEPEEPEEPGESGEPEEPEEPDGRSTPRLSDVLKRGGSE